jgi:hypothetical protein
MNTVTGSANHWVDTEVASTDKVPLAPNTDNTSDDTGGASGSRDLRPWSTDITGAELKFLSQWPIPHSTDVLQTYSWGTLDALKVILPQVESKERSKYTPPVHSDRRYDYYQVSLEDAKTVHTFPDPLIESIMRSKQWQDEDRQGKENATATLLTTACLTIGLRKHMTGLGDKNKRCIVLAVVDGLSLPEVGDPSY